MHSLCVTRLVCAADADPQHYLWHLPPSIASSDSIKSLWGGSNFIWETDMDAHFVVGLPWRQGGKKISNEIMRADAVFCPLRFLFHGKHMKSHTWTIKAQTHALMQSISLIQYRIINCKIQVNKCAGIMHLWYSTCIVFAACFFTIQLTNLTHTL